MESTLPALPDLVGRDDELQTLADSIRTERSVVVTGEAGIGKTSLVRAGAARAGSPLFEGGGFATLASMPYLALQRAISTRLHGDAASAAEAVERVVGPDVLFVDDLQWVDPASLGVLELLAGRVLLVAAIRTGDQRTDPTRVLARRLGLAELALGGLPSAAARALVARRRPDLGSTALEQLVGRAGGNPLVLEELATHGAASPVLRRALIAGTAHLSPSARDVAESLAVADRPIERTRLRPAVGEALAAGVVVERDGFAEIRHALVAEAIRSELGSARRRSLHEAVAALVDDPVAAARHLEAAGRSRRASTVAETALERETDPTRRAALLAILADTSDPAAGPEPRLVAARAHADLADWEGVLTSVRETLGEGTTSPTVAAELDVLRARAAYALGRHGEARAALERARTHRLRPDAWVSTLVAIESAAFVVNVDGEIGAAIASLDRALGDRSSDDPGYHAIRAIRECLVMLTAQPVDLDYLRAAVDAALERGAFASAADLARVVGYALLIWVGPDPANEFLDRTAARFEAAGVAGTALEVRAERVQAAVLAGRPELAASLGDELLERPAPLRARQAATIFRARALGLLGRFDEAEIALDEVETRVTDDFVGRGELLAARAELALWGGFPDRASEWAGSVRRIPSPIVNAHGLPAITEAWARHEAGLPPGTVPEIAPTRIMAGTGPELDGLWALADGDVESAAARFATAASLWAGFHEPRAAWCRWAAGDALRLAGRRDDAVGHLRETLDAATVAGLEVVARRVRRSLGQAGARPRATRRAKRDPGVRLTPRERELLELAGRGLTNQEIARRMGLGRPTVSRILSNAMAKLGARSRAQAVAMAAETG